MNKNLLNISLFPRATALILLCLITLTPLATAQTVIGNRSAGGAFNNAGVTTFSWTQTISGGTNRAVFVGISTTSAAGVGGICALIAGGCTALPGNASPVVGVTYNGAALTQIGTAGNTISQTALYYLLNPPIGTGTIEVTLTPLAATHAVGNSISFSGVNQTTPTANFTQASGSTANPAILVSGAGVTANDTIFDNLASTPSAGFLVEAAAQTVCTDFLDEATCTRGRRFFSNSYDVGASSTKSGNSAGVAMNWTITTEQPWSLAAVVVKAALAPTAAGAQVSGRVLAANGRGVARMSLRLTESDGSVRTAVTNSFGSFRFANVAAGQTIVIEGATKKFHIAPQVLSVNDNIADLILIVEP